METKYLSRLFQSFPNNSYISSKYIEWLSIPKNAIRLNYPLEMTALGN